MNRNTKAIIKGLFEEDQADRRSATLRKLSDKKRWAYIQPRDKKRIEEVKRIIEKNSNLKGLDYFRAGIIFQHGTRLENIKTAQELAHKGHKLGHKKSKWLYAAATDRILTRQGKKQRFGTQYQKNDQGKWGLYPVQKSTTDKERRKYNVKSLQEAKEMVSYLNRRDARLWKKIGLTRRK